VIPLSTLWMPILVSTVIVVITSTILWMNPFWHRRDYGMLTNDREVVDALASSPSGQYMVPSMRTAEDRQGAMKGPMGIILMRNPASAFSFPAAIGTYFVFTLVVTTLVAYIAAVTLPAGTHYLRVFRVVGTAGILAYSFTTVPDSIWYAKPWSVTARTLIDGVIYGLLMAGTFGWLWPR
jgi:hypothetical protein